MMLTFIVDKFTSGIKKIGEELLGGVYTLLQTVWTEMSDNDQFNICLLISISWFVLRVHLRSACNQYIIWSWQHCQCVSDLIYICMPGNKVDLFRLYLYWRVFRWFSLYHLFQRFFDKHDKDKDGLIDFGEFVKYVRDHESKLRLYFKNIDINDDGESFVEYRSVDIMNKWWMPCSYLGSPTDCMQDTL